MSKVISLIWLLALAFPVVGQDLFLPSSSESEDARFHYQQGMLSAYNADFSRFEQEMNIALQSDSGLFLAWYQQAIFAHYFGNQQAFEAFADRAIQVSGDKNPAERILSNILQQLISDPQTYVGNEFARIADLYPWVVEAHAAISFYERRQANHTKAIGAAQQEIRLRPDFGPAYNTLAYAYLAAGKTDHAEVCMLKYLELQPQSPNPYDSLGDLYMEREEYAKSASYYEQAFSVDPSWTSAQEKARRARQLLAKAGK